jgi:hypothetical protein
MHYLTHYAINDTIEHMYSIMEYHISLLLKVVKHVNTCYLVGSQDGPIVLVLDMYLICSISPPLGNPYVRV